MDEEIFCKAYKLPYDEYYGAWILCDECGYDKNLIFADYCGRCGKHLKVVGKATYDWKTDEYTKEDF